MMQAGQSLKNTRQRIVLADALRGFALMGLFIVHMVEYFELYWYQPEPGWVHNLIFFMFGGKAYGIFALLFGLSFFIIMDNNLRRGVDFRKRFLWRLSLLWAFGYVHSLLYAGDILQLLALCGLLLVLVQSLRTFWLVLLAVIFLLQFPAIGLLIKHSYFSDPDYQQPQFVALMGANFKVFAHGSFTELIQHNVLRGQMAKWAFFIESGRLWNIIGLMFVGVILGRAGFFEKERHEFKFLLIAIVICLLLFAGLYLVKPLLLPLFPEGMSRWTAEQLINYYNNLLLIALGVLTFVLCYQFNLAAKLLNTLAPAGRMSLTLYLGQACIFVPLYYGFGLAWYSSIGQVWSLLLGVVFWCAQVVFAAWWLKSRRYGPLEKLWRSATHMQLPSQK